MEKRQFDYAAVSQILQIPVRTLRYWITSGLMGYPELVEGRKKLFGEDQLEELKALKWFLKTQSQSFDTVRALKNLIAEKSSGKETLNTPLALVFRAIGGEIFSFTPLQLRLFIGSFLKGRFTLKDIGNGEVILSSDFLGFKNPCGDYRYGRKDLDVTVDSGFFNENRSSFIEIASLEERFKDEPVMATRIKRLIAERIVEQPHIEINDTFYFTDDEVALAEQWIRFIDSGNEAEYEKLRRLRGRIESNVKEKFPYALVYPSYASLDEPYQVSQIRLETDMVSKILKALKSAEIDSKNPLLADLYAAGLYEACPEYCETCGTGDPVIKKVPIAGIPAESLRYLAKYEFFSKEEVIEECHRRIEKNREEIRILRYNALKNIRRYKK